MSYETNWNSTHPGHIVYLIDLSNSMRSKKNGKTLIDTVLGVMSRLFLHLSNIITVGNEVLEYLSVTVIGYNDNIISLFDKKTAEEFKLFCVQAKKRGYLFDTKPGGEAEPGWRTFMADAFDAAAKDIKEWIAAQKARGISKIPAPIVINITDGIPYEGNEVDAISKAKAAAEKLKGIKTQDGNTLLFNIHFTTNPDVQRNVLPDTRPSDDHSKLLFDISSPVPAKLVSSGKLCWPDCSISEKSRAMVSNEDNANRLLEFITWGTSTGGAVNIESISHIEGIETAKPR